MFSWLEVTGAKCGGCKLLSESWHPIEQGPSLEVGSEQWKGTLYQPRAMMCEGVCQGLALQSLNPSPTSGYQLSLPEPSLGGLGCHTGASQVFLHSLGHWLFLLCPGKMGEDTANLSPG